MFVILIVNLSTHLAFALNFLQKPASLKLKIHQANTCHRNHPIHPHTIYMQTQIKGHCAHSTLKAHYSHRIGSQKHNYDSQQLIHLKTNVPLIFQTFNQVILVNELW
jgi:hypothetical protein